MSTFPWLQALHLDSDIYDHCYQPGASAVAIKDHMKVWHPTLQVGSAT